MLASQEGLCSMELVGCFLSGTVCTRIARQERHNTEQRSRRCFLCGFLDQKYSAVYLNNFAYSPRCERMCHKQVAPLCPSTPREGPRTPTITHKRKESSIPAIPVTKPPPEILTLSGKMQGRVGHWDVKRFMARESSRCAS